MEGGIKALGGGRCPSTGHARPVTFHNAATDGQIVKRAVL